MDDCSYNEEPVTKEKYAHGTRNLLFYNFHFLILIFYFNILNIFLENPASLS